MIVLISKLSYKHQVGGLDFLYKCLGQVRGLDS